MLAKALSGHPELIMRARFPYENRSSQHLFTWGMNGREWDIPYLCADRDTGVKYQLHQRDDEQSKKWFSDNKDLIRKYRAVDITDKYYEFVATIEGKTSPKAYVEKSIGVGTIRRMHNWGWPLKKILMIRDPRDILLSVNSFNRKHNMEGFGADKFDDRELLRRYIAFFVSNRRAIGAKDLPGLEVKYENLKNNPQLELKRIATELGLDDSDDSISSMVGAYSSVDDQVTAHRTQKNIDNTIRWPDEATDEQLEMFSEFQEELSELSYPS
ncbi:hypothetical protein AB833_05805 [Chromatiales bacterium (ex Bugula neritina AB1)]|nr:hypothetical protein AB833_05805 [Chromatiales bacterium (ex Bugula neritina AB1)]